VSRIAYNELSSVPQIADGLTFDNTTQLIFNEANTKYVFPTHFFTLGRTIRITIAGMMASPNGVAQTHQFFLDFGTAGTVNVYMTGNITLLASVVPQSPFLFTGIFTVRAVGIGTATTLMAIGNFISQTTIGSVDPTAGGTIQQLRPATAPAVGSGFNIAEASQALWYWATSGGQTYMKTTMMIVEALN
jgi:hypothetical protein